MPAPAYNAISMTIPANILQVSLDPGATAGQPGTPLQAFTYPSIGSVTLNKGATLGSFNILGVKGNNALTGAESADLTAINDPFGNPVNMANVLYWLVLNLATTSGYNLLVGGAATNPWASPFNGTGTSKLVVPPSAVINNVVVPGLLLLGGPQINTFAVSGTSKSLQFDFGANTGSYRLAACGLSA
jgi:hypothetical protein